MSDISAEIRQLRNAEFGEEVRGAFISCMEKIHGENESYNAMKQEVATNAAIVKQKVEEVDTKANQAVNEIAAEKKDALEAISNAKADGVSALDKAKKSGVEDVQNAQTAGVQAVNEAVKEIESDRELIRFNRNIAIRETAEGEIIHVEDSAEYPVLGLKIAGKTLQKTTNGYQMFDASKFTNQSKVDGGSITVNNVLDSTGPCDSFDFKALMPTIKAGDVIYLKFDCSDSNGICEELYLSRTKRDWINGTALEIQQADIEGLCFMYAAPHTSRTYGNIMVSKESVKPYEPFTGGNVSPSPDYPQEIKAIGAMQGNGKIAVKVKTTGKNLFNINGRIASSSSQNHLYKFFLKPNTKYTLSSNVPRSNAASLYFQGGSSFVNGVFAENSKTFESDSNGYLFLYVRFMEVEDAYNLYDGVKNGTYYIQLEEGEMATTYEPYQESTAVLEFDAPLYEGDRIYQKNRELWLHRENGIIEFNGTETWHVGTYSNTVAYVPINNLNKDNKLTTKCTHFKQYNNMSGQPYGTIGFAIEGVSEGAPGLFFGTVGIATDVSSWKKWLAANPIMVVYKFEEAIETKLCDFTTICTFDKVTNVMNDQSADMCVDYAADTKTYIDNKFKELAVALVAAGSEG